MCRICWFVCGLAFLLDTSACANNDAGRSRTSGIDVSGIPAGQCRLRVTGAGAVEETVVGSLTVQNGGRLVTIASTKRENHFTTVVVLLPAAATPGTYDLNDLAATGMPQSDAAYRATVNQLHQGNDTEAYPITTGTVSWQSEPLQLAVVFDADKRGKVMHVEATCNGIEKN